MLDYTGIFRTFNKYNIKYIVCGGLAVNFYGIPRMTYDIDLLLDMSDRNLEKFCRLLKRWGFKPRATVDIMDFSKKDKRENWIKHKNMKAFNLINPEWAISEIDVLIDAPLDYSDAIKGANVFKVQGVRIPVVSKEDLIRMKSKTGRIQDRKDVKYLKELGK